MLKAILTLLIFGIVWTSTSSALPERPLAKINKSLFKDGGLDKIESQTAPSHISNNQEELHHVYFTCYLGQGEIAGAAYQKLKPLQNSASVTAIAYPGYRFTQWDDGSTDNPRKVYQVQEDQFHFAKFERTQ